MTPTRPITWSDEELEHAWQNASGVSARASRHFILSALNAFHPAEVRALQREGWDACFRYEFTGMIDPVNAQRKYGNADARDKLFPSLPSPAPLDLSTGTWVREAHTKRRTYEQAPQV